MREKIAKLEKRRHIFLKNKDKTTFQTEGTRKQSEGFVQERVDYHRNQTK